MRKICVWLLVVLVLMGGVAATCGDGLCDLSTETYGNCPQDCKEDNLGEAPGSEGDYSRIYDGPDSRILPTALQKNFSNAVFLIPFIAVIIASLYLLVSKAKIAGKSIQQYLRPVRFYVLGVVLIVISQYVIGIPLSDRFPSFIMITQALWMLMVIFSLVKLVKTEDDFTFKNSLILGILYSVIIHGLKVSIRYFFYERPVWYLVDRFIYGSLLVMVSVIILGPLFVYLKKKGIDI